MVSPSVVPEALCFERRHWGYKAIEGSEDLKEELCTKAFVLYTRKRNSGAVQTVHRLYVADGKYLCDLFTHSLVNKKTSREREPYKQSVPKFHRVHPVDLAPAGLEYDWDSFFTSRDACIKTRMKEYQKLEGLPNGAGSARAFVCVITENGKRVWTTFAAFSKENKLHTFMYGGQTGNGFRLWFEGKKGITRVECCPLSSTADSASPQTGSGHTRCKHERVLTQGLESGVGGAGGHASGLGGDVSAMQIAQRSPLPRLGPAASSPGRDAVVAQPLEDLEELGGQADVGPEVRIASQAAREPRFGVGAKTEGEYSSRGGDGVESGGFTLGPPAGSFELHSQAKQSRLIEAAGFVAGGAPWPYQAEFTLTLEHLGNLTEPGTPSTSGFEEWVTFDSAWDRIQHRFVQEQPGSDDPEKQLFNTQTLQSDEIPRANVGGRSTHHFPDGVEGARNFEPPDEPLSNARMANTDEETPLSLRSSWDDGNRTEEASNVAGTTEQGNESEERGPDFSRLHEHPEATGGENHSMAEKRASSDQVNTSPALGGGPAGSPVLGVITGRADAEKPADQNDRGAQRSRSVATTLDFNGPSGGLDFLGDRPASCFPEYGGAKAQHGDRAGDASETSQEPASLLSASHLDPADSGRAGASSGLTAAFHVSEERPLPKSLTDLSGCYPHDATSPTAAPVEPAGMSLRPRPSSDKPPKRATASSEKHDAKRPKLPAPTLDLDEIILEEDLRMHLANSTLGQSDESNERANLAMRSTATYMFLPPKQLPAYDEFLRLASQTPDKHKQDAIADEPSRRLQRGKTCKREADVYRVETSSREYVVYKVYTLYEDVYREAFLPELAKSVILSDRVDGFVRLQSVGITDKTDAAPMQLGILVYPFVGLTLAHYLGKRGTLCKDNRGESFKLGPHLFRTLPMLVDLLRVQHRLQHNFGWLGISIVQFDVKPENVCVGHRVLLDGVSQILTGTFIDTEGVMIQPSDALPATSAFKSQAYCTRPYVPPEYEENIEKRLSRTHDWDLAVLASYKPNNAIYMLGMVCFQVLLGIEDLWGDGNNPSAKDPYKHIALGHQRIDSEVKSLMASCDSATVKGLLLDVVVVLKKMMEDDPEKRITYLLAAKRLDEIWNQLRDGSR